MTPAYHPHDPSSSSVSGPDRTRTSLDQAIHPHHGTPINPLSETDPATANQGSGAPNSSASSVHEDGSSMITDSGESVSSLGGLNHVNDGVGGSTAQRRMSRVYSNNALVRRPSSATFNDLDQLQRGQQQDPGQDPTPAKKESCLTTWLRRNVPMYGWLFSPGYNLSDLPDDLIAGVTISTVVIPQSMAYAMLAPLPPVYGLYTSVAPILIYCIFGTSRHMHTGTFAISSLLIGQAARDIMSRNGSTLQAGEGFLAGFSHINSFLYGTSQSAPAEEDPEYQQRFIGMVLMLSFVIGFVQFIMSFLRVGGWASKHLLPDALVGGFNTAAVFHIGTSQLKHFLGIRGMPSPQGAFVLIKSWMWISTHLWSETNWYTVAFGTSAIAFMLVMRSVEKKRKAAHELELRKKDMLILQQRQAVSEAIVRDHQKHREQQREQQRRWEEQQRRKSDGGAFISSATNTSSHPETPRKPSSTISEISLRTVGERNGDESTPLLSTASTSNNPRTPGDAELALHQIPVEATSVKEREVYIPIPDILLAVILLTIINVVFSLDRPRSEGGWGIDVIGYIPKGLPEVIFPANRITAGPKEWMTWSFLRDVVLPMIQPALLISVIIYVMSFSIAKQFGKRYGYKVDANQEMLALGVASMGGSIFGGYACCGSLTRTAILSQSGARTPLASIVGVVTVVLTLICLTWCFERVPNAVLAAIVLVALQSLVMQITEPLKLWRLGQRKAASIWLITFSGVLILSVELGIAIGIAVVLLLTGYSRTVSFYRGEEEAFTGERRRSSARRMSQGFATATDSLLNNTSAAAAAGASGASGQRRGSYGSDAHHLSAPASPASRTADWKAKMLRTKWGQRIGSFFGMEQPVFSNTTLHTIADENEL
ncbi:MAG: sulfate transporter family-domain-containing protein [Benniella sp.]|nr:MAG: sulfate transporter family-domain-containing protein [Benniella sp.]